MYKFVELLDETEEGIEKLRVFEAALEGIVLFLALALLFLVFKIPVKYAFPPSGLYVLYRVLRYRDAFRVLEVRYKELKIRLRTAYDNRSEKGIIIGDLAEDVARIMRRVSYSAFLDQDAVKKRVVAAVVLSFLILTLAYVDFKPIDLPALVMSQFAAGGGGGGEGGGGGGQQGRDQGPVAGAAGAGKGLQPVRDIFGSASMAKLEGENMSLQFYLGSGETRVRDVKEKEKKNETFTSTGSFPVTPIQAEAYAENIPERYEGVVRTYFDQLTKEVK
ncbi:MAG: hypothetical protein AABX40_03690 [Candidatus Hydrothermarchaeota archaeon]